MNTRSKLSIYIRIFLSMEDDMLVAVDIANQYVTSQIELLKLRAADIARDIDLLYGFGGVLRKIE